MIQVIQEPVRVNSHRRRRRRGRRSDLTRLHSGAAHAALARCRASAALAALDALIVLSAPDESALWRRLPEAAALACSARTRASGRAEPAQHDARPTRARRWRVLGFVKHPAQHLRAPELRRQAAARTRGAPARRGSASLVSRALPDAALWCEALLTAAWTESFALPAFRSARHRALAPAVDRVVRRARAGRSSASPPARAPATWYAHSRRCRPTSSTRAPIGGCCAKLARRHRAATALVLAGASCGAWVPARFSPWRAATAPTTPASRSCAGAARAPARGAARPLARRRPRRQGHPVRHRRRESQAAPLTCSTCTPTWPAARWRWPRWWRCRSCRRR